MALTGLAIAAAIGLAKSEMVDKPKEDRQRKLAAETQRNSPWTGLKAGNIQEADPWGTAMQYGATGAQMGAGASAKAPATGAASTAGTQQGGVGPISGNNYSQDANSFFGYPQQSAVKKTPWG